MAPRSNWKGFLKLSLVSTAIAIYPATSSSERVRFNLINRDTGHRLKRQLVDAETGEVVDSEKQVRGYALDKETYVLVEDDELDQLALESTHTIDVEKFVPKATIDDRYRDAPYYIAPTNKVGEEAFAVIRDAMKRKKMVAIARVVIARRERIIMIEPLGKGLMGTTLHYDYEVRSEDAIFDEIPDMELPDQMLGLAEAIIERMSGDFEPKQFKDRYEDAVVALIQSKQAGEPVKRRAAAQKPSNVVNLMDALRRSIETSKPAKPAKPAPREQRKRRRKA